MKVLRPPFRQGGQAAVETAIILPLHIFLLLGIFQWGLIAHARSMAKYAAYRAVRVGVMQHANPDKMKQAAMLALLPVIAQPKNGLKGQEYIEPTQSPAQIGLKMAKVAAVNTLAEKTLGRPIVNVVVCGPLKKDVNGASEANFGVGDSREVDFDDPRASTEGFDSKGQPTGDYFKYVRTKLRVQVQFLYRMPIPFANWVLSYAYLGMQIPSVVRMGRYNPADTVAKVQHFRANAQASALYDAMVVANKLKVYFAPINVNYSMRMQSDFYLSGKTDLPEENKCFHYTPSGG